MFAKTIIDSDAFIDMPLSTQALYFHLSMRADDDGFINNPKKIQRMVGASDEAVESIEIGFAVANYIYCCHFLKPRIYNCFAEHFGE